MTFSNETFAKRLKAMRAEKGLDQKQLAELSGVTLSSIVGYEAGRNTPGLDQAYRLADALGCTLDVLSGRVDISGVKA